MICVSLSAATNEEMMDLLSRAAREPADVHELRLDSFNEPPDTATLIAASTRPVVATCRSRRNGGGFDGDSAARVELLARAIEAGAAYVDAEEADVPALAPRKKKAVLIAGMMDRSKTPKDLRDRLREMAKLPADWIKFAVTVRRPADNMRVLEAIASSPRPCIGIGIGIGEGGLVTRILGPALGSRITFGSLEAGRENMPAQPTVRDLAELYRVSQISDRTRVYGLLGNPVMYSRSTQLFNQAFAALDLDAVFVPFQTENAAAFLNAVPGGINLCGLSVTTPHKAAALTWAQSASEAARRIGAANTLTLRPDGWRADNSDCLALFESMKTAADEHGINLTGAPALLLGSGATSRAIGVALTLLGCRVTVAARKEQNARRLAWEMDWDSCDLSDIPHCDWKVVANGTPVGMYPDVDQTLYPTASWRAGMAAFDAVQYPRETRFIREARGAGAVVMDLEDMLRRQVAGQFKMWTGETMPGIGEA